MRMGRVRCNLVWYTRVGSGRDCLIAAPLIVPLKVQVL